MHFMQPIGDIDKPCKEKQNKQYHKTHYNMANGEKQGVSGTEDRPGCDDEGGRGG